MRFCQAACGREADDPKPADLTLFLSPTICCIWQNSGDSGASSHFPAPVEVVNPECPSQSDYLIRSTRGARVQNAWSLKVQQRQRFRQQASSPCLVPEKKRQRQATVLDDSAMLSIPRSVILHNTRTGGRHATDSTSDTLAAKAPCWGNQCQDFTKKCCRPTIDLAEWIRTIIVSSLGDDKQSRLRRSRRSLWASRTAAGADDVRKNLYIHTQSYTLWLCVYDGGANWTHDYILPPASHGGNRRSVPHPGLSADGFYGQYRRRQSLIQHRITGPPIVGF